MLLRGRRDGRGHGVPVVCPLLPAASLLGGQGSQRAQPLTRSRTPPLCTAAPARPLPHPGGPRLQSAGPGAGPAASALRPRPSALAPAALLLPDGPRPRAQPSSTTLSARWAQLLEAACVT